jgi:hypothetical protein
VDDIDRLAREVNDIKELPRAKKRRIGFVIDDDRARLKLEVTICGRSEVAIVQFRSVARVTLIGERRYRESGSALLSAAPIRNTGCRN